MARLYNLARMTVTVGGTGVITLGPVVTGYLSFVDAGVTNGLTISYAINDPTGGGSEVGIAIYSSTGPTLTRTPVTSTNANNRINVSTSAQVAIAPAAAELNLLYGFAMSTTDNAIVRFDGVTGGTQNSGVTIDDSNNIVGLSSLTLVSVDPGTGSGPSLDLYRNSPSPAINDAIGLIDFSGNDSAGNKEVYARIIAQISDPTNTSEDSTVYFQQIVAGGLVTVFVLSGGNLAVSSNLLVTGEVSGVTASGAMLASQSDQEAASATNLLVSPGRQQFHPSAAKWWLKSIVTGGTPAQTASYNVTSITDTATGRLTVTIGTDFSSADWVCGTGAQTSSGTIRYTFVNSGTQAAGSIELACVSSIPALADPEVWHAWGFGDQ